MKRKWCSFIIIKMPGKRREKKIVRKKVFDHK